MARTIQLTIVPYKESWPYGWTAWADQDGDEIRIRSPAHLSILGGVGRATHELEHALDSTFTNETHHPLWHFCIRTKSPIRLPYHNKAMISLAVKLLKEGQVEVE